MARSKWYRRCAAIIPRGNTSSTANRYKFPVVRQCINKAVVRSRYCPTHGKYAKWYTEFAKVLNVQAVPTHTKIHPASTPLLPPAVEDPKPPKQKAKAKPVVEAAPAKSDKPAPTQPFSPTVAEARAYLKLK